MTYRWLINTWKDTRHRSLLEECKSKLRDINSHGSEWPFSKSLWTINAREGVEKRELSCTIYGNVNWYSHYGRWYGDSLKKNTRNKITIWPRNPTPRPVPWGNKTWKRHMYPLLTAALFTIARTWKQPRCPSADEWKKKLWYIHTMECYSAINLNAFVSALMRWMILEPII